MYVITARNVNDAWAQAKVFLNANHTVRPSRAGQVMEAPTPVCTHYYRPTERVLFDERRNANPFFHFFEGLWMLAGRNDVEWIARFNRRMREFSDDGVTFHGAYGYRWRRFFDLDGGAEEEFPDQLSKIVRMLRDNPDERRAVLQMWDMRADLDRPGYRDLPCNLVITFKIRRGSLDMVVMCRSNDAVWGAYGANAVHMSMLQEYLAGRIGVPVGHYWQVSDSWHAYTERWDQYGGFYYGVAIDPYTEDDVHGVRPYPMVHSPDCWDAVGWDADLSCWMDSTETDAPQKANAYTDPFFSDVAQPLYEAWQWYKLKDFERAVQAAQCCVASDWRHAALRWIARNAQAYPTPMPRGAEAAL